MDNSRNGKDLRILFLGTPEFAALHLEFLLKNGHNVVAVISQADKPRGRGQKLLPTPVKEVALRYNIPVFQPKNLTKEGVEIINEYKPDIGIVVAYGRLLKKPFLDAIPFYNIHTSLLPKYRGAAPMQRCLENGEKLTGVTIFKISEGMDDGDIALQKAFEVGECETLGELYEKMTINGTKLLDEFLKNYPVQLTPQDHSQATYAPKIEKEDLYVDFSKSAGQVRNKIRSYDPVPGAKTVINGVEVKLYGACEVEESVERWEIGEIIEISRECGGLIKCGENALWVKYIQFPGKSKITFADGKNGGMIKEGMLFQRTVKFSEGGRNE
ncbi:MAG: methionyl-tRNA formyltransferase [Fervidobacterium sp.]|uniref:methionyl-tRNA formyltransferase n=1 Tax=Fervidobacterium TaxID=2422 RepID=UPI0030B14B1D